MGAEPALACQRRAARVQLPGWERQAPCSLWLPMSCSAQPAISSSSAFGERPLRRQPRELQTAGGNADPFNTLAEMEVLYANGDGGIRSLRVQAEHLARSAPPRLPGSSYPCAYPVLQSIAQSVTIGLSAAARRA